MVTYHYSQSEWDVVVEVLGPNPRHLFELYALKQSSYWVMGDKDSAFEDVVDAYLAYLQVTVVNPAMDKALSILQKIAVDAKRGGISKDKLRFGAPWRHPPCKDNPIPSQEWAKIQLMDFIQSLVNTDSGVNYLADCSLEILDDPCALALMEVGFLYAQRDPSFIRPVSRGIQRCLACPREDANEPSEINRVPLAMSCEGPKLSSFNVASGLQIEYKVIMISDFLRGADLYLASHLTWSLS